jgi:nucleoside-diphosphate-sugar epimerase
VRRTPGPVTPDGQPGSVRQVVRDLARPGWTEGLPAGIETVVHLAQSGRFRQFPEGAADVFAVNVASTAALLDWARRSGVRRVVLASSGGLGEVGAPGREPGTLGYYLASKRAAELLAGAYQGELVVVVLRFFFAYGPGQRADMLLPRLVRSVATGQPVVLHGPDGLRCNPVHVADAAAAVGRATALPESGTYDVAGPDTWTLRQVADCIGAALGQDPVFDVSPCDPPGDLVGDVARSAPVLGTPVVGLADGLAELVAHLDRAGPG